MDMLVIVLPALGAWFIGRHLGASLRRGVDALLAPPRDGRHD